MSLFFVNLTNKQTLKVQTSHYSALLEPNLFQTALQPTLIRFPYHWVCDIKKEKPNIKYKKKEKKNEYKTKAEPKQAATKRQRPPETAQRVACELNRYTINDTEPITCDTVPNLFLACSLDPDSDPLLPRTHLPKAPPATCTERESLLVQYVSGCVCGWVFVGGRVCGACQWLSPSASERTSASAAKYATLLAFGRRCGKKPPKAPHPQTKHKFGERRNSCQGCQCCPPTQRSETRRDE